MTGGLSKEIQELACLNCVTFMVSFVPQSCNGVAHALAVLGCVGPGISRMGEPIGHRCSRTHTMAGGRRGRENRARIHSISTSVGQSSAEEMAKLNYDLY